MGSEVSLRFAAKVRDAYGILTSSMAMRSTASLAVTISNSCANLKSSNSFTLTYAILLEKNIY